MLMDNLSLPDCPTLSTARLVLEPVAESHAEELCAFFADPELHTYVPLDPPSLEVQRERCAKWARRRAPDGSEIWLNWVGREAQTGKVIAHFQSGVKPDGTASIGYVVAKSAQGQGFAFEGMQAVFAFLKSAMNVIEVKAWCDTRNERSHRLARRLGMTQVGFLKDADFFKGATSDEFVFAKQL